MTLANPSYLLLLLIIIAAYFGAAVLGLSQAFLHANVSPIWPPTGFAIAAVWWLGYRISPAILLGAFLANAATGVHLVTAAGIAVGNMSEAITAVFLLRRFVGLRNPFSRAQDVVKFVLIAGALSTAVSATIGNLSLCLGGSAAWADFGELWITWWLGDGVGALVVAPPLITWIEKSSERWPPRRLAEAALLVSSLSVVAYIILGGVSTSKVVNYSLWRLIYAFLLWAAFRFGPPGVATTIALFSGIAVWATRQGFGPFIGDTPHESLLLLQIFVTSLAVTFLLLAAIITERKMVEEEREHLLAREQSMRAGAEKANRLKDEFLATISHELRTPLNAILGWSHILRNGKTDDASASRALETIERNAKLQAQLIEDLLDVSRISSGKLRLDIKPIDLTSVIKAAIDSVQHAAETKGIQLQMILDPAASHSRGDEARLQQVVWNLLSNAVKFSPKGGLVKVRLDRADSTVQISVTDTGEGISPEFLPYVFDRFQQADGTTTRRHGGLGLGLAIARHIVELHGGTIQAYSPGVGKGASFRVRLPLVAVRTTGPLPTVDAEDRSGEETLAGPSSTMLYGLRILAVDDETDTRYMLKAVLEQYGANVVTAASAREAFDALSGFKADVLVCDIGMPVEDGYSLIRKVRALEPGRGGNTPAIALTGYVRVEERMRALDAGYEMFVSKPVEVNELVSMIANLVGRTHRGMGA